MRCRHEKRRFVRLNRQHVLLLGLIVFVGVFVSPAAGNENGATSSSCEDMKPKHQKKNRPQSSKSPYRIVASSETYASLQRISLSIESRDILAGILLQARAKVNGVDTIVGRFITHDQTQFRLLDCPSEAGLSGAGNSLTQRAVLNYKSDATFAVWEAPPNFLGNTIVRFVATFLRDYQKYWVKVESEPLDRLENGCNAGSPCENGGTCLAACLPGPGPNCIICLCRNGWGGPICTEATFAPCASTRNKCRAGAACIPDAGIEHGYQCQCPASTEQLGVICQPVDPSICYPDRCDSTELCNVGGDFGKLGVTCSDADGV